MTNNLKLKTKCIVDNIEDYKILKVLSIAEYVSVSISPLDCCLILDDDIISNESIYSLSWGAVISLLPADNSERWNGTFVHDLTDDIVSQGDIIGISECNLNVLYRRGSNSNMLFMTEQCDNHCLMCSQPPKRIDDSWRIRENLKIIDLIDKDEKVLGISGGEPTLLRSGFLDILSNCKKELPETALHILSNGRALSDIDFVKKIIGINHDKLIWGIPLYGSNPQNHDFNVQSHGAFNDTISGLLNLALFKQTIELRIVLTKNVYENINNISSFIKRNLPFVHTIAIMGLEPIGYARMNREIIWCELQDYISDLIFSVNDLRNSGLLVLLYNIPICILPKQLRSIAVKSISDWKNIFFEDCDYCDVKNDCCGFFKSHQSKLFIPKIRPIKMLELAGDVDEK